MEQNYSTANSYYDLVDHNSASTLLTSDSLSISRVGNIQISYAPFDYIEKSARLVIVGITPGMTQAVNALNALHSAKLAGKPLEVALREAKMTASFSGAMRSNLIEMLDYVGVAKLLGITTTASLFDPSSTDMHFTSSLRYPVFVDGKNYSGNPSMLKVPVLKNMVETHLAEEARMLSKAIWLPLGPKAEEAIMHLVNRGELSRESVLAGMPHPSGANAERIAVFTGRKAPELASRQTDPKKLLDAAQTLKRQINGLNFGEAA